MTTYNDNKKCNSHFYEKADVEENVLHQISKLQNDTSYLDELFSSTEDNGIDRDSYQKQIEELTAKLSRLNDLYIDDRITLEELQRRSAEFTLMRGMLEAELENDQALKQQEQKDDMRQILNRGDVLVMDYEGQKVVVRALINKVQVTSEEIVIKWKI